MTLPGLYFETSNTFESFIKGPAARARTKTLKRTRLIVNNEVLYNMLFLFLCVSKTNWDAIFGGKPTMVKL